MSKELISIIIPVYNTKKYLERCIESVRNQTYKNLEIILVDDGSTDGTGDLCDEYKKLDSRIVVLHKENGGQGTARNLGINVANGEYIAFVDSDDWIEADMYEELHNNLKKYDADISCCNNGLEKTGDTGVIKCFNQEEIMREHLNNNKGTGHSPCDKLYKSSVFDGVRFLETRAYEDCGTIFKLLFNAKKVVYEDTTLYHYEYHDNSTMSQSFSPIKFYSVKAYYDMYQFYQQTYPQYSNLAKCLIVGSAQYCIGETLFLKKKKAYSEGYNEVVSILKELSLEGLPIKNKISVILICYCPVLYDVFYKAIKHKG